MDHDLYGMLGVASSASEAEIRHAFRELAKKYHPDVSEDKQHAARRFIEVHEAAETLLDTRRRAEYDLSRALRAAARPPAPHPAAPRTPPPAAPRTPPPAAPRTPPSAAPRRPAPEPGPAPRATANQGKTSSAFSVAAFIAMAAMFATVAALARPHQPAKASARPNGNGTVLWRATGYRLDEGWGTNLAGQGMRVQIYPGTHADLEVGSGYLSAGGHTAFLPRGMPPTYANCLAVTTVASTQSESLSAITPGVQDLCSSGSAGDIAFIHVTRNNGSALTMNITIWQNI